MTETKVASKEIREDSVISIRPSGTDICRICLSDDTSSEGLISPCLCSGSVRGVHEECLNHWIEVSKKKECEICKYSYLLKRKIRWEWLPLCSREKRKLIRSLAYTLVSLGWVIASLIIVIKSSMQDFSRAEFHWRLWTNIVMENVGCFSVIIFLFVWGNFYVRLILRLIEHNSLLVIDTSMSPPKKTSSPENQKLSSLSAPQTLVLPPAEGIDISPTLVSTEHLDAVILDINIEDKK